MSCNCKARYSIELCNDDYVLCYARCAHHHGYVLATLTDIAFNFEPRHIERLLNTGAETYESKPHAGYLAE